MDITYQICAAIGGTLIVCQFVMTLFGGKRGLLVNSADICAVPPVSNVKAIAQNNIGAVFTSKLRGQCNKRKRGGKDKDKGKGKGKGKAPKGGNL